MTWPSWPSPSRSGSLARSRDKRLPLASSSAWDATASCRSSSPSCLTWRTPWVATILIGVLSVIVAIAVGQATLANWLSFGALVGFMALNATVVWHFYIKGPKTRASLLRYLVSPAIGFGVCAYIFANMGTSAYKVGFSWLAVGLVYLLHKTAFFTKPAPVLQLDESFRAAVLEGDAEGSADRLE